MHTLKMILATGFALISLSLFAQQRVTISECYERARENYPLVKKKDLLDRSYNVAMEQLQKSRLPQITWEGKTSIQSESIEIPFVIPGQEAPAGVPLYNVHTYLHANYTIYDAGLIKAKETIEESRLAVEKQSVELELFRFYKQVNEAFFGVLLVRAQDSILTNSIDDLTAKLETLEAGERHGVILPSEVSKVKVQILKLQAKQEELTGLQKSLLAILQALTEMDLTTATTLDLPKVTQLDFNEPVDRPELEYFDLQKQLLASQVPLIDVPYKPRVSAFVQTGLGYPNPLNFFDDSVSPYAMGGVQFRWNFLDWGKKNKDKEYLTVQALLVDNQRETFEYNMHLLDGKYREEVAKIDALIEKDKAVAALQEEILEQVASQLKHGVAQVNDYLTEVNAGIQAQLNLKLHEVEKQKILVDYLTEKGLVGER